MNLMKVLKSGKGNNLEQWKRENIEKKENGYEIKLNTSNTIFFPFIEQKNFMNLMYRNCSIKSAEGNNLVELFRHKKKESRKRGEWL